MLSSDVPILTSYWQTQWHIVSLEPLNSHGVKRFGEIGKSN